MTSQAEGRDGADDPDIELAKFPPIVTAGKSGSKDVRKEIGHNGKNHGEASERSYFGHGAGARAQRN